MKKFLAILVIFCVIVAGIIIINQIQQLPIPDNQKYIVNPSIIGHYAIYNAQFSLNVLRFRLDYIGIVNDTQDVIIKDTLYLTNGQTKVYYSLISLTGTDNTTIIYDNQVLVASTMISIPDEAFYVFFPIISPNLQQNDFVNLKQRSLLMYNAVGVFVNSLGGTFDKYTFRSEVNAYNYFAGYSYTWDRATGILISYQNQLTTPKVISLVDTDVWNYPWLSLYKPTSISIFASNLYNVFIFVVGLYFMRWEVWVLTFGIFGYFALKNYLESYFQDRKAMFSDPEALQYLAKVEKQDEKVKWIA